MRRRKKQSPTTTLAEFERFASLASGGGFTLRAYQRPVVQAILDSITLGRGLSLAVMFPRQSGKNELQAQIEAFLLYRFAEQGGEIVKIAPTLVPQALTGMHRLETTLASHPLTAHSWRKERGYIYRLGMARASFFSGAPSSHIVGATASLLLACDEAQDVLPVKWDKEVAPMAAAYNATRAFWGTAWTRQTLLSREMRLAQQTEAEDGVQRAFLLDATQVAAEIPAYQEYLKSQIARLGRDHPLIRSQYFSEEIDAESGLFPPARRALMQGEHPIQFSPLPGAPYVLLLDVAGQDERTPDPFTASFAALDPTWEAHARRDATALTVVQVDLSTLDDPVLAAPSFRVVHRYLWTGVRHTTLYAQIRALAEHWNAQHLVVDATGIGAGLASFLSHALPGRVIPFTFSVQSKSELGWAFIALVESGCYKEYRPPPEAGLGEAARPAALQERFWREAAFCQAHVLEGPARRLRWGVPEGQRDPATGEPVHDDLLISAALCASLDRQPWGVAESRVIAAQDPLAGMRGV